MWLQKNPPKTRARGFHLVTEALLRELPELFDFVISNCARNCFRFDEHGWHLEAWDDHHHLAKVLLESAE